VSATIRLGTDEFRDFERLEVTRDLEEIAGGVTVEGIDMARLAAAWPAWWRPAPSRGPLRPGEKLTVELDGEPVLLGWVDEIKVDYGASKAGITLTGRDVTGDLVDCAAAPHGPAEYANVTLLDLCRAICAPYGIAVRAEVDLPQRFPRFGIDAGETALSAIEKACRQRAVLALSDGLGTLVLTRGGRTAGPAPLVFGGNIVQAGAAFTHAARFSEYLVKGQSSAPARGAPALITTAAPLAATPDARRPLPTAPTTTRARVVMTGRAVDPKVGRHRPTVLSPPTQSGGASAQEQADWAMRTARAKSESMSVTVSGWRAGPDDALWRPNQRVWVEDPLADVSHELLISSVTYRWGADGATTELRLSGVEAFDLLPEAGEQERRARRTAPAARIATAEPLAAAPPPPVPVPSGTGRR